MKKLLLLILAIPCFCLAQTTTQFVDGRVFTILNQPYTELVAPQVVNNTNWDLIGWSSYLGFSFTLFGQASTHLHYSKEYNQNSLLLNLEQYRQMIYFDCDFTNRGNSSISHLIDTTSSHKIFKLQWKNLGMNADTAAAKPDSVNFQLWLYETNGVIEVHWGESFIQSPDVFAFGKANFCFVKNNYGMGGRTLVVRQCLYCICNYSTYYGSVGFL